MEIKIFEKNFEGEQIQAVTSRDLYRFLGLEKSNYSKWCKNNIENNIFAEKLKDYDILIENKVVPKEDFIGRGNFKNYILTIRFAEKLCMQSKTKIGEEIREYFINIRDKYKKLLKDKVLLENHKLTLEYKQFRLEGKVIRKTLTDIIKDLENHFVEQGYNSGGFLYSQYTNIITKNMFDYSNVSISYINKKGKKKNRNKREFLSAKQLKKLEFMEQKIADFIDREINNKTFCKEIYNKVKKIMDQEKENFGLEIIIDNQLILS